MTQIDQKARELGIPLDNPPQPPGKYVAAMVIDGYCRSAGHLPLRGGTLTHVGKVGAEVSMEEAAEAARVAVGNCLASIYSTLGDLDRIEQMSGLFGYVNAAPEFTEHHLVTNAASQLLLNLFGNHKGRHVRTSVGVAGLPFEAPIEVAIECRVRT